MKIKKYLYLAAGLLAGILITYFLMKQFQMDSSSNESHVIAYEIQKMNKMIVAEQTFSDVYSHKNSRYIPGLKDYFSFDKKVLLLVNAKVQATYDLSKLSVEIDSTNQKIIIQKVPDLEIQTFPDVKFYDLEQSSLNSFSKDELNQIQSNAIQHIEKSIDQEKLKKQAHAQLIDNLGNLYLLGKAYGWEIVDQTPYAKELELKFK
ncbi:DUF4230 domain-containing protein [Moheibacter stercoris]|uniref:DUF4230 domain-containing protein n=1 Tax=Moheibacter stercoris TaxID=1628251 RepID=A0ABV2LTN1_9FLAO